MTASAFEKIAVGLRDALHFAEGTGDPDSYRIHVPETIDVRAIRLRQKLSQEAFAMRYGFTVGRIRDWEQGRTRPDKPSRLLLKVIEREPEALARALASE